MPSSLDLLNDACVGLPASVRKMFGGYGYFAPNGGMFAGIVTDDAIIMKLADEKARAELIAQGGAPWVYDGQGKPMTMAMWIVVPESFLDDPEQLQAWARRAHALVPPKTAKPAKVAKPKAVKAKAQAAPAAKKTARSQPKRSRR